MLKALFEDHSERLGRWLASVMLSRLLWDNTPCKQLLLQIQVGTDDGKSFVGAPNTDRGYGAS